MEDIAPALIADITEEFRRLYDESEKIRALLKKVTEGTATYAQAQQYALEVSRLIGKAYEKHISSAALPDGRMYYNIASRLIPSTLDENYRFVSNYAVEVQKKLNEMAGIGLRAKAAQKDGDRIEGLVNLASSAERYDDVSGQLLTAVENFSQSVVDKTIEANADLHYKAGLSPKIIRKAERKCCKWCSTLAGEYDYQMDMPDDVFRRHENCRCTVLYDPADGKNRLQDVHTKRWTDHEKDDKIRIRKTTGLLSDGKRRYEPDVQIPKGVGAKQKDILVDLPNGDTVRLTPGSRIEKVQTIAGKGRNRKIDIIDLLTSKYKGTKPDLWQKKKGIGYVEYDGESYRVELHWYEEPTVGRVRFKVKPDADGNWFYEDE